MQRVHEDVSIAEFGDTTFPTDGDILPKGDKSMRCPSLLVLATVVFALGCGDRQPLTGPNARPGGPRLDISDGAHDNGNDDFFFLPPMVKEPTGKPGYKDEAFHPGVRPHVTICQLETATQCAAGDPFKHFAPDQVSLQTENYQVNWDTKEKPLIDGKVYRIQVFVGDVRLGYADVQHADNRSELKNVETDEFVPLIDGRTLPIKFRIEVGALCEFDAVCSSTFVDADVGGTFYAADGGAAINFEPGDLPADVVLTIERVPVPPGAPCVAGAAVGSVVFQQWEGCFRMTTAPDIDALGGFTGQVEVAVCIEPGVPEAVRENLLLHKFDEGEPVQRPEPITPPFPFDCDGFEGTPPPNPGPIGLARDAVRMFAAGLARVFGPRTAYALDGGLGCILAIGDGLSTFFWGLPVTASASAGDGQEVLIGTTVPIAPSVEVMTVHPDDEEVGNEPVSDVPVTFTVVGGGGTLLNAAGAPVSSVAVLTNVDGIATLPTGWTWNVGAVAGLNTLVASGPFDNGSVTFTVTAVLPPNLSVVMQVPPEAPPLRPSIIAAGEQVTLHPWLIQNLGGPVLPRTGSFSYGFYLSDDAIITTTDTRLGGASITNTAFNDGAPLSFAAPILTIPLSTAPGVKYVGILVDEGSTVADVDRSNNVVGGIPLTIEALSGGASDPTGDGGPTPSSSNDLVSADATASSGTLTLHFRYAPATRDPAFKLLIGLDTDENPETGHRGIDSGCSRDNGVIGAEYVVRAEASGVSVSRYLGPCNTFAGVGAGGLSLDTDGNGFVVTVPLALLGGDAGRLTFKATSGSGTSGIYDVITNEGAAPVRVGSVIIE
jgi:hypothetical protein